MMSLTQQKRLYTAERCLTHHGRDFASLREVVSYLDDICDTDWFVKRFGWINGIQVRDWNSGKWAGCADRLNLVIYLKIRNERVVLHELAHLLAPTDEHDEAFVNILSYLIRNAMGFYAWAEFEYELQKADYYAAH